MEKYLHNKTLKIVLLALILIRIIFLILNNNFDIYFLALNINQSTINLVVDISIIIIFMLLLNYKIKNAIRYLINFMGVILIVVFLFINLMFNSGENYFYFEGPNKSRTLVIEESSFLLAGSSRFYERKGLIFIKDLKSHITTDDGYKPFSNNNYYLTWLDNNSVELNYDFGLGNGTYEKTIIEFN